MATRILLFSFVFFFGLSNVEAKDYVRKFYSDGRLQSEGWLHNNLKTGYWKFYYSNGIISAKGHFRKNIKDGYWFYYTKDGTLEKEGHYVMGRAEKWWIFYDLTKALVSKVQFENDKKNGYGLCYLDNKLVRAKKYLDDKKLGEWISVAAFKKDNPNVAF